MDTNTKIENTLYFKYTNLSNIFDKKKYKDLNPIIAKIFELYTINGSVVTAKIAGILSSANNKSVNSIVINAPKSAVKTRLLFYSVDYRLKQVQNILYNHSVHLVALYLHI